MEWNQLLEQFASRPLFHSSMLRIFAEPLSHVQVQLSRWTRAGKLEQIRRGWYIIAKPWRTLYVPSSYVAGQVVHPSYISTDWVLQYHGMIPEHVFNITAVTTGKPIQFQALGVMFYYHHVPVSFFNGYISQEVEGYSAYIAVPEKALLDKLYFFMLHQEFSIHWLRELRLQQLQQFDCQRFRQLAVPVASSTFQHAVDIVCHYIQHEWEGDS